VSAQQLRLGVEVAALLTVSIGVVVHGGEHVMPLARCDVSSAWHLGRIGGVLVFATMSELLGTRTTVS
jgi:hypothetical protein